VTVKIYGMTCGWLNMHMSDLIGEGEGTLRVPVPAYLIEHPKGRILFDSGMHKSIQDNAKGRIGGLAAYLGVEFEAGDEVAARLAQMDIGTNDIDFLVNSHLHFDHAGGNDAICDCPVICQQREWEAANDPDFYESPAFCRDDYDTGQDMKLIDGEHDIFGDGAVVCIPTYGHTPGHQSLKVKSDVGEVLLTGDACYLRQSLEELKLPGFVKDKEQSTASLKKIRELEARGARLIFGHDPDQWATTSEPPKHII